MKIAVFGGAGFIGSHVADALTEMGHDVIVYDIKESDYLHPKQTMVIGDLLDTNKIKKTVNGCDCVYNYAGIADLDGATTQPRETVVQNIEGTINLLEACRAQGVKLFVYASTIYVYSDKGGFYRCSKQAAELYIDEYQKRYGLDYTILRYGTVYGPRADSRNSVHRYIEQALKEGVISCSADGDEVREYIHVRDAAALSTKILSEDHRNKHVIITGHHPMKFSEFLSMVNEILGDRVKIELNASKFDSAHYKITPYSFMPKPGYKLTTNCYLDMGQGLLECINDINSSNNVMG